MRVPGGASTRIERDACATNTCRFGCLEQRVNPNCPGKIFGRSLSGTLRTRSFYLHLLNVVVSDSPSTLNNQLSPAPHLSAFQYPLSAILRVDPLLLISIPEFLQVASLSTT